jgi:hypothetical protein
MWSLHPRGFCKDSLVFWHSRILETSTLQLRRIIYKASLVASFTSEPLSRLIGHASVELVAITSRVTHPAARTSRGHSTGEGGRVSLEALGGHAHSLSSIAFWTFVLLPVELALIVSSRPETDDSQYSTYPALFGNIPFIRTTTLHEAVLQLHCISAQTVSNAFEPPPKLKAPSSHTPSNHNQDLQRRARTEVHYIQFAQHNQG